MYQVLLVVLADERQLINSYPDLVSAQLALTGMDQNKTYSIEFVNSSTGMTTIIQ